MAGWKNFLRSCNRMGKVFEKFQINLTLNERNASVNAMEGLINRKVSLGTQANDLSREPVNRGRCNV